MAIFSLRMKRQPAFSSIVPIEGTGSFASLEAAAAMAAATISRCRPNVAVMIGDFRGETHPGENRMIKTAVVAMTLLGCDCDAKICEFVSETAPKWSSVAECHAAMPTEVRSRSELQYPLVTAECHSVRQAPQLVAQDERSVDTGPTRPQVTSMADRIATGTVTAFARMTSGYKAIKADLIGSARHGFRYATSAFSTIPGPAWFWL